MDEKAITGGISFKNKRKWDKDEKPEEPPEEPIVEDKREDVEFMLRQERLQGRIDVARGFNYTGLAANTGGAYFILFGVYGFINDPNSAIVINTINDLLGGLRSTCTYIGAHRIKDIPKCTTFMRVNHQVNNMFKNKLN